MKSEKFDGEEFKYGRTKERKSRALIEYLRRSDNSDTCQIVKT